MRTLLQHFCILLARVLLSLFFLWKAVHIILDWHGHLQALDWQGARFAVPLLAFEGFCLLVGGLLLVIGFRGRLGALLLIIFLVPDTVAHCDWSWLGAWNLAELRAHAADVTHALKNVGLLGALLLVLGFGSGGFSFDLLLSGRKKKREK
jgi:uncharacterized membrane protein YphA (DoxX/SURF4 family)